MAQVLFLCLFLSFFQASFSEANQLALPIGFDAIYGVDDREFITKSTDPKIQEIGRSVALIVSQDLVKINFLRTIIQSEKLSNEQRMCEDERFAKNTALSGCTGFLVGKDVIATAGHCFEFEEDCQQRKIVFDVNESKEIKQGYSVPTNNVFSCKKIIAHMSNGVEDFALVRLDRAPKGRLPLKLNTNKKIDNKARVFMIGHPFGLPLMLSRKVSISNNDADFQFTASLDSFSGNSGSPVINSRTLLVEGILVNGQEDLFQDSQIGCYRNIKYDGAGNEGVFRASKLPAF